jgi:heat shock protein HtpX
LPFLGWWFMDPLTFAALSLAYVLGFVLLQLMAYRVAPRVTSRLSRRLSLYTAMLVTAAVILGGGLLALYGVWYAAAAAGYVLPLGLLAVYVLVGNLVVYLVSPWMIKIAYGAREDPELQAVVDEAARRAGMKPPRALLVRGPPNAFAFGNFLAGRYVAVTESLYRMLPRDELLAVVGHELGHHRHRDTVIILLLGLVPSLLYYMGVALLQSAFWGGRWSRDREENNSLYLAALGFAAVLLSFILQVAVLAFSRLREYYADAHGAYVAGRKPMQRALARIHLYYSGNPAAAEPLKKSSLKALFIYALAETVASPFYSHGWGWSGASDIDAVVERLKRAEPDPLQELLSDHPPIPKRLRFLDTVEAQRLH